MAFLSQNACETCEVKKAANYCVQLAWRLKNFLKPDDVTMELATMLDEFSAVDCYRLKKNTPIGPPTKKVLSYKDILKTNFPGLSSTDSVYKLPDSIDMDYIDILSGKNSCKNTDVETKIPIRMESFEKLCFHPELTEAQKQALLDRAKLEAALLEEEMSSILNEEDVYEDEDICSPCCFDLGSPKKDEDIFYEDLKSSDIEIDEDAVENKPLISPASSITEELFHSSEPSEELKTSMEDESAPVSQNVEETESNAQDEQISKENSSTKKKKSVFKRLFSRKMKNNDLN